MYTSIPLPGVYDVSVTGGRYSADVRIIKYSNIEDDGVVDDFIIFIADQLEAAFGNEGEVVAAAAQEHATGGFGIEVE